MFKCQSLCWIMLKVAFRSVCSSMAELEHSVPESLAPALQDCEHSCSPLRKCGIVECANGCLFLNLHFHQPSVLLLA